MNEYTRSTHEGTFDDIRPELLSAIRKHMETYQLGDVESSLLIYCETSSTRQKTGLFANRNGTAITGMLVTPKLLVWTNGKR